MIASGHTSSRPSNLAQSVLMGMMAHGASGRLKMKMKVTDIQRRILEVAREAGGRYRLRAQQPAIEAKLEREACESFVAGDYARWITSGRNPGIVLTDKSLRLYQSSPRSSKTT